MEKMPSKGLYLTMVIVGFFLGVLWGALSISPYQKMKAAIDADDSVTAWDNAKKIRLFFWIGVAVNVLFIIGRMAGG